VENEYCAKYRCVLVNKLESLLSSHLVPSATASGSCQSSFDTYDLSSNEEYLTPDNVAETTPGQSDLTARLLTATRLYLNSPPEAPKNCGQINRNLNDYHSDPMEISTIFWIPDITDWWCQQGEMHSKYTDLSNVARAIFSIIPHRVGVEASYSLGREVIGWRQSKPQLRPFTKSYCNAVHSRQWRDFGGRYPGIGCDEHWKRLGNQETRGGIEIALNGQGPWLVGDVAGQPEPTCYAEGVARWQQADDSCWIHFGHGRDYQSLLVTLATWWCGCI